jgi:hypothetical protein
MMCPRTYHGGGTLVGFGHDAKRMRKDSPADTKDLAAGRKIRATLDAADDGRRAKNRLRSTTLQAERQRKVAAATARKAEENRKRRQLKEERRKAQEAAHVVNQARKKARIKEEARRRADPAYVEQLNQKVAARGQRRMAGVVVERRGLNRRPSLGDVV